MANESELTQALVRELFLYDEERGIFRYKIGYGGMRAGDIAGAVDANGYVIIRVLGRYIKAHRLAWVYVHGAWPDGFLDHADGNPSDNRISNLRMATRSQNKANEKLRRDNSSGLKGVRFHKPNNAWQARIGKNGNRLSLGYYSTADEAHAVYVRAAKEMFGEFARAS